MTRIKVGGKGQALVEFAVVLPLLLLLLVGLINIGLALEAQLILTHAAWEGARAGATAGGDGDDVICGAVQAGLHGLMRPEAVQVSISPEEGERRLEPWPGPRGGILTVRLRYPAPLALPFAAAITLEASASSRMEYSNPP